MGAKNVLAQHPEKLSLLGTFALWPVWVCPLSINRGGTHCSPLHLSSGLYFALGEPDRLVEGARALESGKVGSHPSSAASLLWGHRGIVLSPVNRGEQSPPPLGVTHSFMSSLETQSPTRTADVQLMRIPRLSLKDIWFVFSHLGR